MLPSSLQDYDSRPVVGADYDRVMSFLAPHSIPPSSLNLWNVPIDFIPIPNANRLLQPQNGPCGLFAVLQAHILLNQTRFSQESPEELLIRSVLDIMEKLRVSAFVFCHWRDPAQKKMLVATFEERDVAANFLRTTDFLHKEKACLHLAISFIFLAGPRLISTQGMPEYGITEQGDTTVPFVLLLITGDWADSAAGETRIIGGRMMVGVIEEQMVGYLQVDRQASDYEVGIALSKPTGKVWVQWMGGHFSVLKLVEDEEKRVFWEYDPFLKNTEEAREVGQNHPALDQLRRFGFEASPRRENDRGNSAAQRAGRNGRKRYGW
jgi:hypothetical protein